MVSDQGILDHFAAHPGDVSPYGILAYMIRNGVDVAQIARVGNITQAAARDYLGLTGTAPNAGAYIAWLKSLVQQTTPATHDDFYTMQSYYIQIAPDPNADPRTELAKYNRLDKSVDLGWAQQFVLLNDYFREGQFAPGAQTATLEVMAQANAQWARDAAPGMLDKVMKLAFVAAAIYVGGAAAGWWESGLPMTEATITEAVAAAPAVPYEYLTAEQIAAASVPETLSTAASAVAAGAPLASVGATGMTAAQVLGTAKTVIGAAGTVATIVKLATGATKINPATGAPYGLPPGYQPTVTQGQGTGTTPLNYSGIIKQLAIPAAALLGIFLLKG